MPNLFLELDQELFFVPDKREAEEFRASCGASTGLRIIFKFLVERGRSSVGFELDASSFVSGGIEAKPDGEGYRVKLSGVAKVKVYEMQMTAFSKKQAFFVLDGIGLTSSLEAYRPSSVLPDSKDIVIIDGEGFVKFTGKIGTKKTAMEAY